MTLGTRRELRGSGLTGEFYAVGKLRRGQFGNVGL